jgi:hypothetical protein
MTEIRWIRVAIAALILVIAIAARILSLEVMQW